MDGWMDRQVDGWMGGWIDGQVDGWMDGWIQVVGEGGREVPGDALDGHDEVGPEVEAPAPLLQLAGAHEGGEVQPRLCMCEGGG